MTNIHTISFTVMDLVPLPFFERPADVRECRVLPLLNHLSVALIDADDVPMTCWCQVPYKVDMDGNSAVLSPKDDDVHFAAGVVLYASTVCGIVMEVAGLGRKRFFSRFSPILVTGSRFSVEWPSSAIEIHD